MNWADTVEWLRQGVKVRRKVWGDNGNHVYFGDDRVLTLVHNGGKATRWFPHSSHKKATDWEGYMT